MPTAPTPFPALPRQARAFIGGVVVAALGATIAAHLTADTTFDTARFGVCLAICAAGSFFEVQAPGGHWLQPHLPVFVFTALLAPPLAVAAVAIAVYLPGGIRRHEDPYRVAFNAANLVL